VIIDTDDLSAQELLAALTDAAQDAYPRDRDKFAAASPLTPNNLVGSYFRGVHDDEMMEGMIVAHLWMGSSSPYSIFLVEFFEREGATGFQQQIDLEQMLARKWTFFDSEQWLASGGIPVNAEPAKGKKVLRQEHNE
jgi:hypothetical protein